MDDRSNDECLKCSFMKDKTLYCTGRKKNGIWTCNLKNILDNSSLLKVAT